MDKLENFLESSLICPITSKFFHNPVIASDGIVYEKDAIKTLVKSPMTREPLVGKPYACIFIKNLVDEYLEKYPHKVVDRYTPVFLYHENITKICDIITHRTFDKLKKYTKFDYVHMNKKIIDRMCLIRHVLLYANEDVIKYVIDNLISVDDENSEGVRMIHLVTKYSNSNILQYLIKRKNAYINAKTKSGENALHFIVDVVGGKFNSDNMKVLIDNGININSGSSGFLYPVHVVSQYGGLNDLQLIIKSGAIMKVKTQYGHDCIYFACLHNTLQMFKYLVDIYDVKPGSKLDELFTCIVRNNLWKQFKYLSSKIDFSKT